MSSKPSQHSDSRTDSPNESGNGRLGATRPDVPASPQYGDVPKAPPMRDVPETTPRPKRTQPPTRPAPRKPDASRPNPYDAAGETDSLKVEAPSPASFRTVRDLISERVHGYARERRADELAVEQRFAAWNRGRTIAVIAVGIAITLSLHIFGLLVALDDPVRAPAKPGVRDIVASIPPSNPGSATSVNEALKAEREIDDSAPRSREPALANTASSTTDSTRLTAPQTEDERIAALIQRADKLLDAIPEQSAGNTTASRLDTSAEVPQPMQPAGSVAGALLTETSPDTGESAVVVPVEGDASPEVTREVTFVAAATRETGSDAGGIQTIIIHRADGSTVSERVVTDADGSTRVVDSRVVEQADKTTEPPIVLAPSASVEVATIETGTESIASTPAVVEVAAPEETPAERRLARIDTLLETADRLLARKRLTTPVGDNAYDGYLAVLSIDAENTRARDGIQAIHAQYLAWAKRADTASDRDKALANYQKALVVNPGDTATIRRIAELTAPEPVTQPEPEVEIAAVTPEAPANVVDEVTPTPVPEPARPVAASDTAPTGSAETVAVAAPSAPAPSAETRLAVRQLEDLGLDATPMALLERADSGDYEGVSLLLRAGVAPNVRAGKYGFSPLILAAIHGDTGIVDLLLERGAEVDARSNDGRTALMAAAWNGHAQVIQSLLLAGASARSANRDGWTAMHYAAWQGHAAIVQTLLDRGGDPAARNSDGWTVSDTAEQQGFVRVIELLAARGAG